MAEEVQRDVRWVLIISLVMFLWSAWQMLIITGGYYFRPDFWFYLGNVDILSFIITISLGALYTTDLWKLEPVFKVTILMFMISMMLFFISNMQLIVAALLGSTPY